MAETISGKWRILFGQGVLIWFVEGYPDGIRLGMDGALTVPGRKTL